jgi:hypothetical protein
MSARFGSVLLVFMVALAGCESKIHKAGPPPPPTEVTPGSTFTVVKGVLSHPEIPVSFSRTPGCIHKAISSQTFRIAS